MEAQEEFPGSRTGKHQYINVYQYITQRFFQAFSATTVNFKSSLMNAARVLGGAVKPHSPLLGVLGCKVPQKIFGNFIFRALLNRSKKQQFLATFYATYDINYK